MPASLSALLQSGDYPSEKLVGGRPVDPNPAVQDVRRRIAPLTPATGGKAGPVLAPGDRSTASTSGPVLASIELQGRDPFSLWVHWQVDPSGLPAGRGLRLRLFAHSLEGPWMLEQPVGTTGNRNIPVLYANTVYIASLGTISGSGAWNPIAVSAPVRTAPDAPTHSWTSVMALFPGSDPSTAAPRGVQGSGGVPTPAQQATPGLPDDATAGRLAAWASETLEAGLDANSSGSVARRVVSRVDAGAIGIPQMPGVSGSPAWTASGSDIPGSVSIPTPVPPPTGFWFRVHAELILHGSTEPGASVTIGGHAVQLREDGSFTFRFSLPDGTFDLPVHAVKADGSDRRAADLTFHRHTVERGEVGVHPIDPALRPPVVDSVR